MMTTSYPPHNGGMHPQGLPPGHPMAGGGPNAGQHMPPGMHPGVSGPNGPVSQAGPMMGMQPGMGPNAHALSHLQPQQAQAMFAQQQQQHPGMMGPGGMNNAMMQQQRAHALQQQAFMRQQQSQQMQAQQQGGMGMAFPHAMGGMGGMTPQQQMQLRAQQMGMGQVQLPPHLQQQMQQQQQQMANQQGGNPQQAAAMAQAQAQHQAAQAQQQQQQAQQQHLQAQQAIAMQHAQSQSSNHSQSGNQGPPNTSQPQQGPLRPPSAMSHQGQASPAPAPQPPQQPPPPQQQQQQPPQQQQQQQQQQQSGPQPGQQTPAPAQPPSLPQQPNQQPTNPAQMQQRNPQMAQQAQAQNQAQAAQQAAQARNLAMMKQNQVQPAGQQSGGQGTLKLMNFVDQLGKFNSQSGQNQVSLWQSFVDKFFNESGSFIHVLYSTSKERTKQFEIVCAALPRYFYTVFTTDIQNIQITLDGSKENAGPAEIKVTCDRAKFIYTYENQCQVVYTGKLTAFWSGSDKMEWLQFEGTGHQQYIPRNALEILFHQPSPNQMNPNQSPRMNKNAAKNKQRNALEPPEPYLPLSKLLSTGVTDLGIPPALQHYLEIYETMNNMSSLMTHYLENSTLKPSEALESWNNMMQSTSGAMGQNPQMQGPPNPGQQQGNMPPGARGPQGPGQQVQPMFMSPAMANQLLPNGAMNGSPHMMHTPSPASHQMVKQQSQSSHTASVNTSPNITGKRRRSAVKIDQDDDGPKVKQSPRVGGGKRMKPGN